MAEPVESRGHGRTVVGAGPGDGGVAGDGGRDGRADGPQLALSRIEVRRAGVAVVRDLDLTVDPGEVVALLGPSGAGKSSLLLAVAGLVDVAAGRVAIGGRDVTAAPPHRRPVGMVFQEYALFPHMDVAANIAYGLHGDGRSADEHDAVVDQWLARLGLPPATFRHRDVATLSGGQRQRVALARSLAPAPPVLLLDEPLGALDRQLREELLGELAAVVRAADGPATLVVTHDRDEAFTLGDRVGVLREGRLVQLAAPATLWAEPLDEWTARFLGHLNVLSAAEAARLGLDGESAVLLPAGAVRVRGAQDRGAAGDDGAERGAAGHGGVRPDEADKHEPEREDVDVDGPATVVDVAWRDGAQRVTVEGGGVRLVVDLAPGHRPVTPGNPLPVVVDRDAALPLR